MHYLAFIIVDEGNETSEEARQDAETWLNDNDFASNGYFASGMCDWFCIGGRWTGLFAELDNPDIELPELEKFNTLGRDEDAVQITKELIEKLQAKYKDEKGIIIYNSTDYEEWDLCIYNEELINQTIGKWLVIIDYHN